MRKFEYNFIQVQKGQSFLAVLNAAGEQGWEAWSFDPESLVIYVKREKSFAAKLGLVDAVPPPAPEGS